MYWQPAAPVGRADGAGRGGYHAAVRPIVVFVGCAAGMIGGAIIGMKIGMSTGVPQLVNGLEVIGLVVGTIGGYVAGMKAADVLERRRE